MSICITSVELKYQTDWAKFEVLSPGASVAKHPSASVSDYASVAWTNTSVLWQNSHSYNLTSGSLPFVIVNDGKPVDIKISRGGDGFQFCDRKGELSVTFQGHTYKNLPSDWDEVHGVAEKMFKDCPVNSSSPSTEKSDTKAYIDATQAGNVISKYTLCWSWMEPKSGILVPFTFNINSDSCLPWFRSSGAPDNSSLDVQCVSKRGQPYGLSQYHGVIGAGRIHIEIPEWGITVRGPIEGGPRAGLRFVGAGGWTSG